jgi:hypothetical protein
MNKIQLNILQKYILLIMVVALLFPSAVSITHIYAHEKQEVCQNYFDTHFHKKNIDCVICKYHPTPVIALDLFNFKLNAAIPVNKKFFNHYQFLSDFQKLSFELRGPPSSTSFS